MESGQEDFTVGLPPPGSKHQEYEELGFPICAIYLSGKHRMKGRLGKTLVSGGGCWVVGYIESKTHRDWKLSTDYSGWSHDNNKGSQGTK